MHYRSYTGRRVGATLIDYTFIFFITWVCIYLLVKRPDTGGYGVTSILALSPVAFWFLYFVVAESAMQATLGHLLFGLKVVTMNGGKPSFGQVLVRRVFDAVEISWCFGLIAFILVSTTNWNQRVGDLVAQTRVVGRKDAEQNVQFDFEKT